MKILIVFPLTGVSSEGLEMRKQKIAEVVGADIEFDIKVIDQGPLSIESKAEEMVASFYILQLLKDVEAIEAQYDGILVWCAGDPGVEALRELYEIPVVGPGQAMISMANTVSSRYGMVTPGAGDSEMILNLFYHVGLEDRLVTRREIHCAVLNLKKDTDQLIETIVNTGKAMIEQRQIESLLLGCMGFFGIGPEIEKKLGIPVIDPAVMGLHQLIMMIKTGVHFSHKKYPRLRKELFIGE